MSETFSFAYDHPLLGRLILQCSVDVTGCRFVHIGGDAVNASGAGIVYDGGLYVDLKSWSPILHKTELLQVLNGDSGLRRELHTQLVYRAEQYAEAARQQDDGEKGDEG